jgi:membrane-bound lytic murein transglycosylase A
LSRPADLVRLTPFPDRAAIEDGALADQGLECVWLPDSVELFFAQVQGSARLLMTDGRRMRLTYAGRNGHPYRSIGKIVVEEGHIPLEALSLETLKHWLKSHPVEARRIMRMNTSYVFFALEEERDPASGPIGAAGTALVPRRSIAVDRTLWSYGLPFFVAADLPHPSGTPEPFAALTVAQDTGTAIVGPARIDLFFGSGAEAGTRAGLLRHPGTLTVFVPRGGA